MSVFLGVVLHALGGFASGSFYLPYKKVNGWAWESYWLVGGFFPGLWLPCCSAILRCLTCLAC
nr:L-rhamnose/proton symporter RhaT [Hymenobacter qilianensis]